MTQMTKQLVNNIYSSLSDKHYRNLDEICFFYMLDEVLYNIDYLKYIIGKYNYWHLLAPSSQEERFKEHLPAERPFLMNAELSRLFGHELEEIIMSVEERIIIRKKEGIVV